MEPTRQSPSGDDREDVYLYMPDTYRQQIHTQALRLAVADSEILTGAWIEARDSWASSPVTPSLIPGPSYRLYFYISRRIQDEVRAVGEANDRSMSWVFLKAWEMARADIEAIESHDAFVAWVRKDRQAVDRRRD